MAFNLINERLKPLFDHTSDGVIIIDPSMSILALNRSAEEITGWNPAEKIGKKFPQEQLIHLNSGKTFMESSGAFSPAGTNYDLQMEITLSQGNKVLLPAISFPMTDEKGEMVYGLILENILLKYGVGEKLFTQERLDELTGLLHKDYFEQVAGEEIKRMKNHGGNLGAILVRIENLSQIVQKSGGLKGNEVVKKVGSLVKGNSRDIDLVCRYGENEFMVLLINSDPGKMSIILTRLREKLLQANQGALFPTPLSIKVGKMLQNHHYEELFKSVKLALDNFI
jgi:diguanylate cyclase (GGDEF)-like protein/PAS domain S-box-containing protein